MRTVQLRVSLYSLNDTYASYNYIEHNTLGTPALLKIFVRYNPAKYLYFLGGLFLLGLVTWTYVVVEWFKYISHDLLAIVTAILILGGIQFLAIGFVMSYLFKASLEIKGGIRGVRK